MLSNCHHFFFCCLPSQEFLNKGTHQVKYILLRSVDLDCLFSLQVLHACCDCQINVGLQEPVILLKDKKVGQGVLRQALCVNCWLSVVYISPTLTQTSTCLNEIKLRHFAKP